MKRGRPGRPALPAAERRSVRVVVLLTPAEAKRLENLRRRLGKRRATDAARFGILFAEAYDGRLDL